MKFFPIELPPARVAVSQLCKALKFYGVFIWIGLSRELLEILPNQLIDARPEDLGPAACTENQVIVDG